MKFHEDGFCEEDLIVFTKSRWDRLFPRTHHLMTRFARYRRVFIFEEPRFEERATSWLKITEGRGGAMVAIPHLPLSLDRATQTRILANLVDELREREQIFRHVCWFDTPSALPHARHLDPMLTIYDGGEHVRLAGEDDLIDRADLVLTATRAAFEEKKSKHGNVRHYSNGVDSAHFVRARSSQAKEPCDQKPLSGPRFGFFGVLDERLNVALLDRLARLRPHWNFVFLGPIEGIPARDLPPWINVKYLGPKDYDQIPSYIAGWNAAIVPFNENEKTRSSHPSKIKECLAGGCPVISTRLPEIEDLSDLVRIAETADEFVQACETALKEGRDSAWLEKVDRFLAGKTWDDVWQEIASHEANLLKRRPQANVSRRGAWKLPFNGEPSVVDVSPTVSMALQ